LGISSPKKTKEKREKMAKQGKLHSAIDLKKMKEQQNKKKRTSDRPNKNDNGETKRSKEL